jgi:hypothetical protein
MEQIVGTDFDQAEAYQKKLKQFEKGYFEEYFKIVQAGADD